MSREADATTHVVGAGLAGLAAAVAAVQSGRRVVVHEGSRQAGGRCRSYYDATLDMVVDNGNHLLLSGNASAMAFLGTVGGVGTMTGPSRAEFPFVDLATDERWTVRPNAGRIPWWVFSRRRRVPGTLPADYLALGRLLRSGPRDTIGTRMRCEGRLYERLWQPLLLAALNTDPPESSGALAGAVIRETLAKGGAACRPLIASDGLAAAFVDPALSWLERHGAQVRFDDPLRGIDLAEGRATALHFAEQTIALRPADSIVLAVPAPAATSLLPGITVPRTYRSIVNAHFKMRPPPSLPPILGLIHGTVEWIFAFPDRLSITISGADRLLGMSREALVDVLWSDVRRATGLSGSPPPWQIIREKRATFAATPEEDARRPPARTAYSNLVLAGDWTATGLPATIEGSIRSGNLAVAALA